MVAALATLHLAPTEMAADFLRREGVPDARIRVVGNPVLDAIVATGVRRRAARPSGRACCSPPTGPPTSTTRSGSHELAAVVRGLADRPGGVLFPVHPRTRDRLRAAGLWDELAALPGARARRPAAVRRDASRAGRLRGRRHRQRRAAGGGVLPRRARRRHALDHTALGGCRDRRRRAVRARRRPGARRGRPAHRRRTSWPGSPRCPAPTATGTPPTTSSRLSPTTELRALLDPARPGARLPAHARSSAARA